MTPIILGILNVTTDSFFDGGKYLHTGDAIAHGRALLDGGAHGLDIGGAASNPKSEAVPPEVEIARLAPVVAELSRDGVPLSIDTFSPVVQRWALGEGVAYLNDIHGFPDETLYPLLADSDAKLIVMHAVQAEGRATADDISPGIVFNRILEFFEVRLKALIRAGVARSRLIVDPGMGMFLGRHSEASYEVLRRIRDLKQAFDLPVLISVSRKSFLRGGRDASEAGPATLVAELFACQAGADYIRTHDPVALACGLKVWNAILTGNTTST
jgi:dihydropteroate synthase type 2